MYLTRTFALVLRENAGPSEKPEAFSAPEPCRGEAPWCVGGLGAETPELEWTGVK